jgi:hypothetical protein
MATEPAAITGYTYDELMLKHKCPWAQDHLENPRRLSSILDRCRELNLFDRCLFVKVFLFNSSFSFYSISFYLVDKS